MGKRLTAWCYSQDGRMATALNLLRYKYPNSDNLLRKIDNFENSPDDTKAVLLALYKDYGADWAYAGIHDYFTIEQIAIIEKIYTAYGGHIKSERTDDERKQMSNLALKRGITTDMANRLSLYCYQNHNFQYFVIRILVGKGASDMGSYRIIDNFSMNLDYVEEILLSLYETYGAESAYYTLREFLTNSQINTLDEIYDNWIAVKKEEKRQREEQKRIQIQHIVDSIHKVEPFTISNTSSEYNNLNKMLFKEMHNCLQEYILDNEKESFSVSLSDDVLIDPNAGTTHTIAVFTNPIDSVLIEKLTIAINNTKLPDVLYTIEDYNYTFGIIAKGHFDLQYDFHTIENDFRINYSKGEGYMQEKLILKEGDETCFQLYYEELKQYIINEGGKFRNKIKLKQYIRNGEVFSIKIVRQ